MGKGKGKRARRLAAATDESTSGLIAAPQLAERHGFDAGGLLGHESTYAVNVTEQVALAVSTVYACVRIIADLVSDAEIGEFRGNELLPPSRLALRPMQTMTRRQWLWLTTACMALYNGAWLERVGGRDSEGAPLSLLPVAPPRISFDGQSWRKDGVEIDRARLVWIPRATWPTVTRDLGTVLRLARDVFAAAWAAESWRTDFWQAGGAPVIYISTDQALTNDEATAISDRWAERRAEAPGKPAVVGKGGKVQTLGADAAANGTTEATSSLGSAVAQYFGVPSWLANVPQAAGSLTYANASAAGLDLVRYTLRPGYAGPIGDAWSDELPGNYLTGRRINVGLQHLTEGTVLEQAQAYAIATGNKPWMLPSEVRSRLNMPIDMTLDEAGSPAPAMEAIPNG